MYINSVHSVLDNSNWKLGQITDPLGGGGGGVSQKRGQWYNVLVIPLEFKSIFLVFLGVQSQKIGISAFMGIDP